MGRSVGLCARALVMVCLGESVAFAQPAPGEPAAGVAAPRAKARKHRHRPRPPSQPWRKHARSEPKAVEPPSQGRDLHLVLGAERLTSVLHFALKSSTPGTNTVSATELSFLGGGSASGLNPFGLPRVAFDGRYGMFTFGGSLTYDRTSNDVADASMLLLSPRLGAFWPRAGVLRFWLRGGLSYVVAESDVVASTFEGQSIVIGVAEVSYLDLTLEPLLALMPSEQVGFTLGPTFDIGLGGSGALSFDQSIGVSPAEIADVRASSYGATAGLLVIF